MSYFTTLAREHGSYMHVFLCFSYIECLISLKKEKKQGTRQRLQGQLSPRSLIAIGKFYLEFTP